MTRRLFWKLCLIIGTGVVAMFYLINVAVNHFENDMSMLSDSSREELINWQKKAEVIFDQGDMSELERWVDDLQQQEIKEFGSVQYKPKMVLTLGNHEERIMRHVNDNPELQGFLSYDNLRYDLVSNGKIIYKNSSPNPKKKDFT